MATPSTINKWIEDLGKTITTQTPTVPAKSRRLKDIFSRRIKHHTYVRTNQFEITERLDGLEEKFQVLNRDELSDALHARRIELQDFDQRWIPDVLDLILRLSNDPINKVELDDSSKGNLASSPLPLKWADIEVDDPFDHNDSIWQEQRFSDLSSDADDAESVNDSLSPKAVGKSPSSCKDKDNDEPQSQRHKFEAELDSSLLDDYLKLQYWRSSSKEVVISEIQVIREVLFLLQGYPSATFDCSSRPARLRQQYCLRDTNNKDLSRILKSAIECSNSLMILRDWVDMTTEIDFIQIMQEKLADELKDYDDHLSRLHEGLLNNTVQVISIMSTLEYTLIPAMNLVKFADILVKYHPHRPAEILQHLYLFIDTAYLSCDDHVARKWLPVFLASFRVYMKPFEIWLSEGRIAPHSEHFCVRRNVNENSLHRFWAAWFGIELSGSSVPPNFLSGYVQEIFSIGKTAALLSHLGDEVARSTSQTWVSSMVEQAERFCRGGILSFSEQFESLLNESIRKYLDQSTLKLRSLLEEAYGMSSILNNFDNLYLGQNGVYLDLIEGRMFRQIDRCLETWNDRFLLHDLIDELWSNAHYLDTSRVSVVSRYTSSRSMKSRRQSVNILSALSLEYALPWPIANIIPIESMKAYQRIALLLFQIRRAKHQLERVGYFYTQSMPLGDDLQDQKVARAVQFSLLYVVNTIYDHFTTCMIAPLTAKMKKKLLDKDHTIDEMIDTHKSYLTVLERACMTTPGLKLLRETLISILDVSVRFADLVANPTTAACVRRRSSDMETGSFVSARSRHTLLSQKRRRQRKRLDGLSSANLESDEDTDEAVDDVSDDGEGYSSFIVLDGDDSMIKELNRIKTVIKKQLDFFAAGIHGLSASGETAELFSILALRLDRAVR